MVFIFIVCERVGPPRWSYFFYTSLVPAVEANRLARRPAAACAAAACSLAARYKAACSPPRLHPRCCGVHICTHLPRCDPCSYLPAPALPMYVRVLHTLGPCAPALPPLAPNPTQKWYPVWLPNSSKPPTLQGYINACGALAFVAALRGVIPTGCGVVSAAHCLLRVGDRAAATAARRGANSPAYICVGCGPPPTAPTFGALTHRRTYRLRRCGVVGPRRCAPFLPAAPPFKVQPLTPKPLKSNESVMKHLFNVLSLLLKATL